MIVSLFLIVLFSFIAPAQTVQSISWEDSRDHIDIGDKVRVLEDPEGKFSFEQVSSAEFANRFRPSDQVILNFGFTESVHWLHFSFDNTSREPLVFEISHAFLPVADLFYYDENGKVVSIEAGYEVPLNEKVVKHHFQIFPMPEGSHDFYVRLISNSHPLKLRIFKESKYEIKTYRQRLVYGFYLGFMVFVILSNLFFYITLRNKLYLFYAGIVVIYISYASAVMDGFILYLFPDIDLMFWYITIPTIGVPLQIMYAQVFLEVKKYNERLFKITKWLTIYFLAYVVLKFALPLTFVLTFNTIHALISFFVMGYLGYDTGRRGNRLGYYFALAYFIYFLLVLTEATYIQIGKPAYFIELSHVALATLIEAFLLSFLLSKRFEFEKADAERIKDETQRQLLETTRQNELIVREQNAMLENKVEERTIKLSNTIDNLKQMQNKLIQSEKLASLGELTAGIAHEIQNPLNFVNNFSEINRELIAELVDEIEKGNYAEVKALSADILSNEAKINHHGKRADYIVKGMLQHSRTNSGQKELTDINALADEYLRLSYHGLRARDKSFNAKFGSQLDEAIPKLNVMGQDIGRVLLNLINNAFYAVSEKYKKGIEGYEPQVTVKTQKLDKHIQIRIKDNGDGIPENIKNKIFQPFFTTKPTGQGTGLGLSLSYDIIHKGHDGNLEVESKPGIGTEFIITLPLN